MKNETEWELPVSLRQEQTLFGPENGKPKVFTKEATADRHEAGTQKAGELVNLLKDLGVSKFSGELLIKYESGLIVQVEKTEYIRPSSQQHER